jgi:hypothetical protein
MGGYGLTYTDISDNILYSGKSYSISNGDLFDICNDTVTTVLETILDYLNDFETDAPCLVKISITDGVCGYLASKLTSIDGSVNIITNTNGTPADETLDLSVSPRIDIINSETSLTTDVTINAAGNIYTEGIPNNLIDNIGRLNNNGDTVQVEFYLIMSVAGADSNINVTFGGTNIYFDVNLNFSSWKMIKYLFKIVRLTSTSVRVLGSIIRYTYSGNYAVGPEVHIDTTIVGLSSLDTNVHYLVVDATTVEATTTVTGKGLLMTKLIK